MGNDALNDRRAGTDVVLTKISIGIPTDQDFIGDQILPPMTISTSVATIPVWGNEAWRIREDRVGDFSEPDKLDIGVDKTTFEVDGHALMGPVSDRQEQEAAKSQISYDLGAEILVTIVANMDLAREKQQADLVTSTSIYASDHKKDLNGTSARWDDPLVDPLVDVTEVMESIVPDSSGRRPNTLWMGQQVWAKLMLNPLLKARIFGTITGGPNPNPTASQVAALFGVQKILIGRAISKTVGGVITKLWGKSAGLLYVPPTSGKRVPAFGYTVEQSVFGSASEAVISFRDEKMGASGGRWIKRSSFYTPVTLFPASGYLFYNAVA